MVGMRTTLSSACVNGPRSHLKSDIFRLALAEIKLRMYSSGM